METNNEVQELKENSFDKKFDYAIFCAGGDVSKKYISDTRLPETTSRGGVDRTAKANTSQETEKKEEVSSTQNNVEEQKQTSKLFCFE